MKEILRNPISPECVAFKHSEYRMIVLNTESIKFRVSMY